MQPKGQEDSARAPQGPGLTATSFFPCSRQLSPAFNTYKLTTQVSSPGATLERWHGRQAPSYGDWGLLPGGSWMEQSDISRILQAQGSESLPGLVWVRPSTAEPASATVSGQFEPSDWLFCPKGRAVDLSLSPSPQQTKATGMSSPFPSLSGGWG